MAYNKYSSDNEYVQGLIKQRDKKLSESFKKAKAYLGQLNFFEKILDEKVAFLNTPDGLLLMEGMSGDKLTFVSISDCLEINQNQLHTILRDNPNIYDAIDRGRAKEIDGIEKSLTQLANGYYKEEVTTEEYTNDRGGQATKTKTYNHYFPANVIAATYILQMKRDMEWKQKQIDLEVAKNTIKIEVEIVGDLETNLE